MTELDSKCEISLEGDAMISKIGKLTTSHSPRVNITNIHYFIELLRMKSQCDTCSVIIHKNNNNITIHVIRFISKGAIHKRFFDYKNHQPWCIRSSVPWL